MNEQIGKKILIAGYPKSGNTWLGYMLSYVLGARYVELSQPERKSDRRRWVLDLIEGRLSHGGEYKLVAKTHSTPKEVKDLHDYGKVIHLTRDPRDTAVSYYFFQHYNLPITKEQPEELASTKLWSRRYLLWKQAVRHVAKAWSFHVIAWRAQSAFLVRYEDLWNDAVLELRKICDYLDYSCEQSLLEQAARQFSFEQLSGGRQRGDENKHHFFRKGVVGDYKNYFGPIDKWLMLRWAREQMTALGYIE